MFGHGLISVLIYFKKNITIILECFIVFFLQDMALIMM